MAEGGCQKGREGDYLESATKEKMWGKKKAQSDRNSATK